MLGDSIVEYLPYITKSKGKRGFDEPIILDEFPELSGNLYIHGLENVGIKTFQKYLWPNVGKENVDCFILLLGINNLLRPDCDNDGIDTKDSVYEKLVDFINEIRNSGYRIVVQSLYPVNKDSLYSNRKEEIENDIVTVNEKLKKYCDDNHIEYLDLYSVLIDEKNKINPLYSDDGLHPNKVGYTKVLNEILEKVFLKLKVEVTNKEFKDITEEIENKDKIEVIE